MIPRLRYALLICAVMSGLALGLALASEKYGGLVPCALCLVERWPYRLAAPLAVLGLLVPRFYAWLVLWLCIALLIAAAVLGFTHVGVERGYWPSPLPECVAPNISGLSMAERLARMPDVPSKACEDPTYLIPGLPVSMAAMNTLFAVLLAGGLTVFSLRNRKQPS